MRHLRALAWFLIGVLLVGAPMFAFAETIPATSWPTLTHGGWPTCDEAKGGVIDQNGIPWNRYPSVAHCGGSYPAGFSQANYCANPGGSACAYDAMGQDYGSAGKSCPATGGWTLSGANCTRPDCAAGEVRNESGSCVPVTCPVGQYFNLDFNECRQKCLVGDTTKNGMMASGSGGFPELAPGVVCAGECGNSFKMAGHTGTTSWWAILGDGTGQYCGEGSGYTGPAPVAPDNTVQPDSPGAKCIQGGEGFGTVNGVVVCVPSTTTTKKTSSGTTTTNKDPNGNTISTSTTTNNTTTTTNIGGGSSSTTTTTNPDGSTTTTTTDTEGDGGTCEGEDCIGLGTPTEEGAIGSKAVGPSAITAVTIGGSASCPAAVVLPKGYGTFSYQPACDLAGMIRPLTLVFAWLAAGLIAIGGFKDG